MTAYLSHDSLVANHILAPYMQYIIVYIYMLLGDIHDYIIDIHVAALISTGYSAIFFLSHLDLGYKAFLYMLVGSTTLPCSLASC